MAKYKNTKSKEFNTPKALKEEYKQPKGQKVVLSVPKKFDVPSVGHKGYRQKTGKTVGKDIGFFDGNVGNDNAKYLKDMAD